MCAIFGIYSGFRPVGEGDAAAVTRMSRVLYHRGPDHQEIWSNDQVTIGHNLLKIQDLSNNATQPMQSPTWTIAFNGEVYNYESIRELLRARGYSFRSDSDSEVVLYAIDCWGIDAIDQFDGCFAIAAYDKLRRKLFLVRDRFGKKPLYYARIDGQVLFASEIKGILSDGRAMREIDLDTIRLSLLVRLWLPADRTFFRGIEPVLPGTYVTVFAGGVTTTRYAHTAEPTHMDAVSEEGAIALFTERLNAAVKKRLKARVPIAAFLSGGIDSSYVCAIANRNMSEPLRTFTISYEGDENIDLDYARLMSKEHQLSHRNVIVGAHDYSIQNIDLVTYHVEEVLIDQVYIPMYLNFQAAKCEGYTVVLTGEGADEAWAGYLNARRIFRDVRSRKSTQQLRETYLRDVLFGNKLRPDFIGTDCSVELLEDYFDDHIRDSHEESQVNSYSRYAERTILHNLLLQVDKLSMANAVECRAPFVDRALFELSHATPGELKIRDGREKYVIRRSAIGALPEAIVARRKNGFPEPPLPYGRWIRDICIDAWEQISESPLLNRMLDRASLASPRVFSEYELWILLALFRFEAVFGVGICDSHS